MIDNCQTYSDGSTTCTCSIGVGEKCTFTYYERTPSEWAVISVFFACILLWLLVFARASR